MQIRVTRPGVRYVVKTDHPEQWISYAWDWSGWGERAGSDLTKPEADEWVAHVASELGTSVAEVIRDWGIEIGP